MTNGSLQEKLGESSGPYEENISQERLEAFSKAVGAEKFLAKEGIALPTFSTLFRKGEFALLDRLGIKLSQVLHAEQVYEYFLPIVPNMTVSYQTELSDYSHKKGSSGELHFLTFGTEVIDSSTKQKLVRAES